MRNLSTRFDLGLSIAVFIAVAIACGRVYRSPFADETYTLSVVSTLHPTDLPRYLMNDDDVNKPPLSYLLYYAGWSAGLRSAGSRWISLGCTAAALAIWHWLTLCSLEEEIPAAIRLLIAIIFATGPLALGRGDDMRWYSPFALAVAVAFLIYLRSPGRWFLSGIAMGVAADLSFLAILPFLSLCFHRYVVERKFRWKEEARFFVFAGVVAVLGFITFVDFVVGSRKVPDLMPGILKRSGYTVLGFFGGNTLGLSQLWIVVPAVFATVYLMYRAIVATTPGQFARRLSTLILLTAVGPVILTLSGFAEPRGYLFMTPMISALVSLGLVHAINTSPRLGSVAYAALLICSISVAGNLRWSSAPFMRNTAIPFGEVVDFVTTNRRGNTTIITTDYTTAYELSRSPEFCVAVFDPTDRYWCPAPCTARKAETVVVIRAFPLNEADPLWHDKMTSIVRGRSEIAEAHFGEDDDAYLKSRLSPRAPYPHSLMDVTIYR